MGWFAVVVSLSLVWQAQAFPNVLTHMTDQLGISGLIGAKPAPVLPRVWKPYNCTCISCDETANDFKELDCVITIDATNHTVMYFSDQLDEIGHSKFFIDLGLSITFVLCGGLAAGLTLGLMSLDAMHLEICVQSGTPKEQKMAQRLQPLLSNRHWVLVTLLLLNSGVNEALPLFLNRLMHEVLTIIVSVTAILVFGEIIPQAVCNRYSLQIGYYLAPLVWFLLFITYPISRPIAWILDQFLGVHNVPQLWERRQLKAIVSMHSGEAGKGSGKGTQLASTLTVKEAAIIRGALDMSEKGVLKCMTPLEKVFMVNYKDPLTKELLEEMRDSGHSRIPVYMGDRQHVLGMIIVKTLILLETKSNREVGVSNVSIRKLPIVPSDKPLYDMLRLFQTGKSHMALVVDCLDHATVLGIITLEDVLEELIQEEIVDETDDPFDTVRAVTMRKSLQKVMDNGFKETLSQALHDSGISNSGLYSEPNSMDSTRSGRDRTRGLTAVSLSRYGTMTGSRTSMGHSQSAPSESSTLIAAPK